MDWKIKASIALIVVGAVAGGVLVVGKRHGRPAVTVTLRIAVNPKEQADFVAGQGNSARFKYLIGKISGVKPVQAQRLSIKPVPNTPLLEARVGVETSDEGRLYANAFVETLQSLCGSQVRLALTDQSIR